MGDYRSEHLNDLRSLWEVELPESPEHQSVRHEYERRRAQATAAASSDSKSSDQ